MQSSAGSSKPLRAVQRTRLWYGILMAILAVFLVRAFYMQIIRHGYYSTKAASNQLKQDDIPATRGLIKAHSGSSVVPLVLNQTLYTVYVDPPLIKDADKVVETLTSTLKLDAKDVRKMVEEKDTNYVVVAHRVNEEQRDALLKPKLAGLAAQARSYRIYPNGTLASQVLGFVNNEGQGRNGLEQALDKQLAGKDGQLKAITDINGVPLAANSGNTLIEPTPGDEIVLTLDLAMQKQLETILKKGLDDAKSESGSAMIMDPRTGAIKAMANWPTYNPADFGSIQDGAVFSNPAATAPLEIGSVMKPLTAVAALDKGVIQPSTTYFDPGSYTVDGFRISNVEEDGGAGNKGIVDILDLSLNTGATWLLMRMSGTNDKITAQGRHVWHDYMTNRFMFGKATGIEVYEEVGTVPDPDNGYGRDLTLANSTFGQAMSATPLQLGAAFSAAVNGGTYYQPHLVDYTVNATGQKKEQKPVVIKEGVVSSAASAGLRQLLESILQKRSFAQKFDQKNYSLGGKTGTAQVAKPEGGYYDDRYNGMYVGYVGGDMPQYVVVVRVNEPKISGYAGSRAAQPIFGELAGMLLNNFNVTPKKR